MKKYFLIAFGMLLLSSCSEKVADDNTATAVEAPETMAVDGEEEPVSNPIAKDDDIEALLATLDDIEGEIESDKLLSCRSARCRECRRQARLVLASCRRSASNAQQRSHCQQQYRSIVSNCYD